MPVGFPDYYGGLTLPVTVEEGGTGQTSLTQYGVLFGQGASGVGVTLAGAIGDVLQIPSGGGAPVFQPLDISLVSLSGILPIANGGTGLSGVGSALAVLRVNAGGSALEYHAVDLASAMVTGILPIANGGTGTSTPGLVAGSNMAISGSWPDQTIALATSLTITGLFQINTPTAYQQPQIYVASAGTTTDLLRMGNQGAPSSGHPYLAFAIESGNQFLLFGWNGITNEGSLTITFPSGLTVDSALSASSLSLTTPLPVSSGGTGASSLTGAQIWTGGSQNDVTLQTANLSNQALVASTTGRRYLVAAQVHIKNASGSALSVRFFVQFTYNAVSYTQDLFTASIGSVGEVWSGGASLFFPDSATAIEWGTAVSGFGAGDSYDAFIAALAQ